MSEYPDHIPIDEKPEQTVENIPDDVVESALSIATDYGKCPSCGEEQWYTIIPGHNSQHKCVECGNELRIVG